MPASLLTINGGSSSIKFSVYQPGRPPRKMSGAELERIGSDHDATTEQLIEQIHTHLRGDPIAGIGHRIVHGGATLLEHQLITPEIIEELRKTIPLDLAHLPQEIALIEAMARAFPGVPQVACFDTAFHRDMPRVAKLLPIPRHFDDAGVHRFGFHGLSYAYLMEELARIDAKAAGGRVILAHLGSGASMAAVRAGKPIDTSMAFTPTAGLVMGTRPGDLDPGLLAYLLRLEKWSADDMDDFINRKCGLIGVSQTSNDMRDLLERRSTDHRAAEAVDLFCYQAQKWIGALSSALNGVDTLVFSGGIGEHSAQVRAQICTGLEFLGLQIDHARNTQSEDLISTDDSPGTIRVIATNEEIVIAKTVCALLHLTA